MIRHSMDAMRQATEGRVKEISTAQESANSRIGKTRWHLLATAGVLLVAPFFLAMAKSWVGIAGTVALVTWPIAVVLAALAAFGVSGRRR